jgi:sugar phosphate isomerase/epimerase
MQIQEFRILYKVYNPLKNAFFVDFVTILFNLACFLNHYQTFLHMKKYVLFSFLILPCLLFAQNWVYYSSSKGEIPSPNGAKAQTTCLAADLNKDGIEDVVLGLDGTSALIWYEYTGTGSLKHVIEPDELLINSHGVSFDIDFDGDLDLVFDVKTDSKNLKIKKYWWENPYPNTTNRWKRHELKIDGNVGMSNLHVFADFKQNGKPQFVFNNFDENTLQIADIPNNPSTDKWVSKSIFKFEKEDVKGVLTENLIAEDIDGDGWLDLVSDKYWFKYNAKTDAFKPIQFSNDRGKVVCGKFHPSKTKQIVVMNSANKSRLMLYDCIGNPENSSDWKGRDIAEKEFNAARSLEVADINGDGFLDIFCAEMAEYTKNNKGLEAIKTENTNSEALILYGNGQGNFKKTVFRTGVDFHETKLVDLDGDGDIDIASKPYTWRTPRIDVWMQNDISPRIPEIGAWVQNQNRFGLQLYSLRDYFKKDVPGTFDYVKDLGFKEIEAAGLYNLSAQSFKNHLDTRSLEAKGGLFDFNLLRDSLDSIIEICRTLKTDMIGCAWIPHNEKFNKSDADNAIKVFNEVGKKVAAAGFKFVYHPHGYEFEPIENKTTLYDYMMENTHPLYVFYEIDVFWATHGGEDPVLLMNRYKGRILSLHIKDMAWGQKTGDYTGQAPLTSDVAIGTGQINFREILKAAYKTNIRYLFVEDENAEVKEHLPVSLKYLKGLK